MNYLHVALTDAFLCEQSLFVMVSLNDMFDDRLQGIPFFFFFFLQS